MAARMRKTHQDDVRAKYYVYEVLGEDGRVLYVGKGSGRRMSVSMRERGGSSCVAVRHFASESAAYAFEVKHIAKHINLMNKCKGGNGSKAAKNRKPRWEIEIDRIGTKTYAARLLMKYLPYVDQSKVEEIRRVAHG